MKSQPTISTHEHVQALEAFKLPLTSAPHAITEYLTGLEAEIAELEAEGDDIRTRGYAEIAEREETERADIRAEYGRLRSDALAKDAKVKEIQSKFSFVIGTVSERTVMLDPLLADEPPKAGRR